MNDNPPVTTQPNILALPNGWHLITYGTQQISIDPNGLLLFPRHLTPDQVPDYIGALQTAAEIGAKVRDKNTKTAAENTAKGLPTRHMIVTQGPPPAGATPLPHASIGRPKRRERRRT